MSVAGVKYNLLSFSALSCSLKYSAFIKEDCRSSSIAAQQLPRKKLLKIAQNSNKQRGSARLVSAPATAQKWVQKVKPNTKNTHVPSVAVSLNLSRGQFEATLTFPAGQTSYIRFSRNSGYRTLFATTAVMGPKMAISNRHFTP